jgi:hypothetical protein
MKLPSSLVRYVKARPLAKATVEPRSQVTRGSSGGWWVHTPGETLVALGPRFEEQGRFRLPTRWFSTHAVSPDGAHAFLSLRTSVRCITTTGETLWDVPHKAWGYKETSAGSCQVSPDGALVWATVPSEAGPDTWWVLDARSGALLGQAPLASHASGSSHLVHPDGRHVGLCAQTLQGEQDAYWGAFDAGHVTVTRLDAASRGLTDVRPDGAQYLALMPGTRGGVLSVLPFPDGPPVASIQGHDSLPPFTDYPGGPDSFSSFAEYITKDLVLVSSAREGTLLVLSAENLGRVGFLQFEGTAHGSPVATDGRGHFVTYDSAKRLQLWELEDFRAS